MRNFLSVSFSSSVAGEVLSFLYPKVSLGRQPLLSAACEEKSQADNEETMRLGYGAEDKGSYQLSFCVSFAISSSFPSFSAELSV